ncbi:Fe-S cluster assembly protein SufD [Neoactinobaculum massilliense]|uniref:Fe-S cluster assembly protein SufD n=1 Tax=Neoactinobaculum massilliense TaxID=2364794 RepID=UPI000F51BB10|nr:Fe-S cluster assembly protein SufD [Neoactinobaculum massilliense]
MEATQLKHSDRSDRLTSFDPDDFAVPRGGDDEENWRFTPMDRAAPFVEASQDMAPAHVTVENADNVTIEEVGREDPRLGTVGRPDDRAAALAWAAFRTSHVVTLGEHADAVLRIDAPTGMSAVHTFVDVPSRASGVVVLEHTGAGNLTETVEARVGDDADVTIVSVQEQEPSGAMHSAQRLSLGRNAKLRHIVVTIGGNFVRVTTQQTFEGEGAESNLLGAYITEAGRHHEHRVFVDHKPAHCKSRTTYKGALAGKDAHSVWVGDVLIRADAAQTDTYELNRNLVLTDGALANSVPNLEILTGDIVGAGHASATGRFDEEQLFYLEARGIPASVARRLVVRGFFAELVDQIDVAPVREKLMGAIERELDLGEDA